PDPKAWQAVAESSAVILSHALRLTPEANSLGMTAPRLIGRLPYGAETDPTERFAFEEFDGLPAHDDYLWLNGCYATATLLAAGFAAYG
ncbi:type VI secretion system contractile sheath large subunit, partial [Escherichia coli]|nr:type VI secretion system contractile sheath large subunit [Escherichia coli]